MNMDAHILDEAARWLVRLDRSEAQASTGASEQSEFEAWLAADSRHRRAYLQLEKTWRDADGLDAWCAADGVVDAGILQSPSRRRWQATSKIAASLAGVGIILAATTWFAMNPPGTKSYGTDIGAYERIMLTDGSLVQLNTATAMKVQMLDDRREIRLLRGEAHFQVAHDKQRPFDVLAANTVVQAVGTAFTVKIDEAGAVSVLVTEGSVSLRSAHERRTESRGKTQPRPVSAGEAAEVRTNSIGVRPVPAQELIRRLAWQNGELIFDGMRLHDVVREFNRYTATPIAIDDPVLADVRIGGNFRTTDVHAFLRALRASFGIEASEADGAIHLSNSR